MERRVSRSRARLLSPRIFHVPLPLPAPLLPQMLALHAHCRWRREREREKGSERRREDTRNRDRKAGGKKGGGCGAERRDDYNRMPFRRHNARRSRAYFIMESHHIGYTITILIRHNGYLRSSRRGRKRAERARGLRNAWPPVATRNGPIG